MNVEYLIVGQGLCGTWLSWYLQKENKSFLVIDKNDGNTPSQISAGIVNPVTGRRLVKSWMADEILPFAWKAYSEMGEFLGQEIILQKNLIDFFPNPHQRQVFIERVENDDEHLHSYPEQNEFNPYFNYDLGCGEIRHCFSIDLGFLSEWRKILKNKNQLIETEFLVENIKERGDSVEWTDSVNGTIQAGKIIFCDGLGSVSNPYFHYLPFAPNKGECLVVEIPGLPENYIYKKGFLLSSYWRPNLFWFGSNYQWKFEDPFPSKEFREQAERHLNAWLKIPYKIIAHWSGIRPATIERRPFVGLHPHVNSVGILNGLGTKGCSLAPFFAHQLVRLLVYNEAIIAEADVKRFTKILNQGFQPL